MLIQIDDERRVQRNVHIVQIARRRCRLWRRRRRADRRELKRVDPHPFAAALLRAHDDFSAGGEVEAGHIEADAVIVGDRAGREVAIQREGLDQDAVDQHFHGRDAVILIMRDDGEVIGSRTGFKCVGEFTLRVA